MKCLACTGLWSAYDPRNNGAHNLDNPVNVVDKCSASCSQVQALTSGDVRCSACLTLWSGFDPRQGGSYNLDRPEVVQGKCRQSCSMGTIAEDDVGFRVQGSGFRVQGFGFRV